MGIGKVEIFIWPNLFKLEIRPFLCVCIKVMLMREEMYSALVPVGVLILLWRGRLKMNPVLSN